MRNQLKLVKLAAMALGFAALTSQAKAEAIILQCATTVAGAAVCGTVLGVAHELILVEPEKRFGKNGEVMKRANKVCRVFARKC